MRKTLIWMMAAFLIAGCSDDDTAGSNGGGWDVGGDAGIDAAQDAPADAGDATADAAPTGEATLTFKVNGGATPGLPIVVNKPDGAVQTDMSTNLSGQITAEVAAGSMFTMVLPGDNGPSFITLAGIEPGDSVLVDVENDPPTATGTLEVTLPGEFTDAASYKVTVGCQKPATTTDPSSAVSLELTSRCPNDGGSADVLALALDGDDNPMAYAFQKEVAMTNSQTFQTTLSEWKTDWHSFGIELVGVQDTDAVMGMQLWLSSRGVLHLLGDGGAPFAGGSATASLDTPAGFADQLVYRYGLIYPSFSGQGPQAVNVLTESMAPPGTDNATLAMNRNRLLTSIESTSLDIANAARPSVSWTRSDTGQEGDAGILILEWQPGGDKQQWIALMPPADDRFEVPALPDSLSSRRPSNPSSYSGFVGLVDTDDRDGYADFKSNVKTVAFEQPEIGVVSRLSYRIFPQ